MRIIGRFLLNVITLAVSLLLAVALLAGIIRPDGHNFPGLLGLLFPFLVLAAICCILSGILLKSRWALLPAGLLLLGASPLSHYIAFRQPDRTADGRHIRLVTYNVMGFAGKNRQAILDFLHATEADIICLQETPGQIGNLLKDDFQSLPYRAQPCSSHRGPIITLSRWPILASGSIAFEEGSTGDAMFCDIKVEDDTLRIYTLHLQSYGLDRGETVFIDTMHLAVRDSAQWIRLKELGMALTNGMVRRSLQADAIHSHLESSPYPVIVCGDFNDTPQSYTYQRIKGRLQDAFSSSGKLLGGTYRIRGRYALRIDYFLCDRLFKVSGFQTPHLNCSDHYPVCCDLVIPGPSAGTPSHTR